MLLGLVVPSPLCPARDLLTADVPSVWAMCGRAGKVPRLLRVRARHCDGCSLVTHSPAPLLPPPSLSPLLA